MSRTITLPAVVRRDTEAFFKTLSAELSAQADRVRHLIGPAHWLSDGNHKEALLRGVIERYAPAGTVTSRAFIVDGSASSTEQDVVVVDTHVERPLFHQSGLVIATPDTVLATISVKTQFRKSETLDALAGLRTLPGSADIWAGAYFFDTSASVKALSDVTKMLAKWTKEARPRQTVWLRVSDDILASIAPDAITVNRCPGTATAYFLARCLNAVSARRGGPGSPFAGILDVVTGDLETARLAL